MLLKVNVNGNCMITSDTIFGGYIGPNDETTIVRLSGFSDTMIKNIQRALGEINALEVVAMQHVTAIEGQVINFKYVVDIDTRRIDVTVHQITP